MLTTSNTFNILGISQNECMRHSFPFYRWENWGKTVLSCWSQTVTFGFGTRWWSLQSSASQSLSVPSQESLIQYQLSARHCTKWRLGDYVALRLMNRACRVWTGVCINDSLFCSAILLDIHVAHSFLILKFTVIFGIFLCEVFKTVLNYSIKLNVLTTYKWTVQWH